MRRARRLATQKIEQLQTFLPRPYTNGFPVLVIRLGVEVRNIQGQHNV